MGHIFGGFSREGAALGLLIWGISWLLVPFSWEAHGATGGPMASTPHVKAEMVSEFQWARPGAVLQLGLKMKIIPGWHTYWKNPGDSGLATKVEWALPKDWKVGDPLWPIPSRYNIPPLTNFGYSGETLLGFPLQLPKNVKEGTYPLEATASWLVCEEECIPESVGLRWNILVKNETPPPTAAAPSFAALAGQQPEELPEGALLEAQLEGREFRILFDGAVFPQSHNFADFFPLDSMVVKNNVLPFSKMEGTKTIFRLERAEPFSPNAKRLRGWIVSSGKKSDRRAFVVDTPFRLVAPPPSVSSSQANSSKSYEAHWLWVLFLGFLGGMLLNLMPCVFPVLAIKAMGLLKQSSGAQRDGWGIPLAYALGVLISFWILAFLVLALRASGRAVGWGFQLQEPWFVCALALIFTLMGANLAGLFEWSSRWAGAGSALAGKDGRWGSFFSGCLAVVVATPCTAPFMGTALAVLLTSPFFVVFSTFTALGLGLAAPYLILAAFPQWARMLPKPGPWMVHLKEFFAFPLFATVIWLLWVFGQQRGITSAFVMAGSLLLLLFGLWTWNRWQRWWVTAVVLALVVLSTAQAIRNGEANVTSGPGWESYSEEGVKAALDTGASVFVDFTAAWCITCQVNKKLVLDTDPVREFFAQEGVRLFRADWTNYDPLITKALERYGRVGVPLYLAWPKGAKEPVVLDQVLTEAHVKQGFRGGQK